MKRVLLTGATGLIGKYAIQPLLDNGFEVIAVSTKQKTDNNVRWISCDLLDSSKIKELFEEIKPQYLLHLAWDTTPGSYLESNSNFDWLKSGLEMLKYFKLNGGTRAVFAGTCFEYEFKNEPLKEDGKLNPVSTYAKCKNHLNSLAQLYCEKNGLSFGWGRIFYVYGEGENEKRLIPQIIQHLNQDREFVTSSGHLVKDYMFAGDIACAFVKFLDSNVEGCVNICTQEPVQIKDIAELIAQKLGKEHLIKLIKEESDQPPFIIGDNARLKNEVKFTPKYDLSTGIDQILKKGIQ